MIPGAEHGLGGLPLIPIDLDQIKTIAMLCMIYFCYARLLFKEFKGRSVR
jgi:hypothetical protein